MLNKKTTLTHRLSTAVNLFLLTLLVAQGAMFIAQHQNIPRSNHHTNQKIGTSHCISTKRLKEMWQWLKMAPEHLSLVSIVWNKSHLEMQWTTQKNNSIWWINQLNKDFQVISVKQEEKENNSHLITMISKDTKQ